MALASRSHHSPSGHQQGNDVREPVRTRGGSRKRLNRELDQLLNELRVAMPGVQVLFAFLLAVPFQQRFAAVSEFQMGASGTLFITLWFVLGLKRRLSNEQSH